MRVRFLIPFGHAHAIWRGADEPITYVVVWLVEWSSLFSMSAARPQTPASSARRVFMDLRVLRRRYNYTRRFQADERSNATTQQSK